MDNPITKLPKYVFRRPNGSYRYKRNVPKALRQVIPKATIYRQLGNSYDEAIRRLPVVHAEVEALFDEERSTPNSVRAKSIIRERLGEWHADVFADGVVEPEWDVTDDFIELAEELQGRLTPEVVRQVGSARLSPEPMTLHKVLSDYYTYKCDNSVGDKALKVKDRPEVHPHGVLTDEQVSVLLAAKDRVLHSALLFGLLTGMRSGEICGLMAEDITAKGNLGRFVSIRPNAVRLLKSKAAEREVPLHGILEQLLDTALPTSGRLFPYLTVDKVVKRYAYLRRLHPELHGTVFHSTRKWFITQCERTGVPEHFTATLVGHHSARSANKLTYGLYSAGISDAQKREIVEGVRLPTKPAS